MKNGLKLIAEDEEDLNILSAHLQDAVIRVADLAYLPKSHRFAALLNRYCWEDCGDEEAGVRIRAGLHFDSVVGVKAHKVRQNDPNAVVSLLAIKFVAVANGGSAIDLLLAGGGRIRLSVEGIDATLRDLSGPWPAKARPEHDVGAGAERK